MRSGILIVGLLCLMIIYGCGGGAATQQTAQTSDNRPCVQNLTTEGSYVSGRIFKTHQLVRNVSKSDAMVRAARYIAAEGFLINSIDKELGLISASQGVTVASRGGKTLPLNVSIQPVEDRLNVSLSFSVPGGITVSGGGLINTFCSIIEAIEK